SHPNSTPDLSSLALATLRDGSVLASNVRAFSPHGKCATRSRWRRVPHERQKCSAASLRVDLHPILEGTYLEQLVLFGWRQSRHRGGGGVGGRVDRVVGSRRDWLFTGWKGGEMVLCHRVAAHAQPPAQGQPCKELISCLRPRVL